MLATVLFVCLAGKVSGKMGVNKFNGSAILTKLIYNLLFFVILALGVSACSSYHDYDLKDPEQQKAMLEDEGEQAANFYFKGDPKTLYMKGVIYGNTLKDIKRVLDNNPQVTKLVMVEVPGSIDDEINLLASREIRNRGITTHIPKGGWVASGGTDMFLAGAKRTIDNGARLGVHSWGDGEFKALDFAKDDPIHQSYLDYYQEMQIPTEFYWYTLDAAPVDNMHWMTPAEIKRYKVLTQ